MPIEPVKIAGLSIAMKAGGGLSLLAEQDGQLVRLTPTDREAATLALALLRAIPQQLGRETLAIVLDEIADTLPEALCIQLGLNLIERHAAAFEARVLLDRAQRMGAEVAEA